MTLLVAVLVFCCVTRSQGKPYQNTNINTNTNNNSNRDFLSTYILNTLLANLSNERKISKSVPAVLSPKAVIVTSASVAEGPLDSPSSQNNQVKNPSGNVVIPDDQKTKDIILLNKNVPVAPISKTDSVKVISDAVAQETPQQ